MQQTRVTSMLEKPFSIKFEFILSIKADAKRRRPLFSHHSLKNGRSITTNQVEVKLKLIFTVISQFPPTQEYRCPWIMPIWDKVPERGRWRFPTDPERLSAQPGLLSVFAVHFTNVFDSHCLFPQPWGEHAAPGSPWTGNGTLVNFGICLFSQMTAA